MDRTLRRYTELINYRNKLNEEHPEWNFVDVFQLSNKLAAMRMLIKKEHVAFLALHMSTDTDILACNIVLKNIRKDNKDDAEAYKNIYNAIIFYWKEALQLTKDEYDKIKPDLESIVDSWV